MWQSEGNFRTDSITGIATFVNEVTASVALAGDPRQLRPRTIIATPSLRWPPECIQSVAGTWAGIFLNRMARSVKPVNSMADLIATLTTGRCSSSVRKWSSYKDVGTGH